MGGGVCTDFSSIPCQLLPAGFKAGLLLLYGLDG